MESNVKSDQDLGALVMQGFVTDHQKMLKRAKLENKTLIIERDGKPVRVKARDL
ncbi:hypothetical protein [Fibrella aquatica]|jgi:hypothetical protein|uniref:hypothetical protein n=1 Tax=Fibrella aquatica TaxID=3242487 RepID=UPI00351FBAE4